MTVPADGAAAPRGGFFSVRAASDRITVISILRDLTWKICGQA